MPKYIQLMIMMMWMILFSIMFMILTTFIHPVILMILMIIYNLTICFLIPMWKLNSIFSILIFLIMISGLLIIFMYFSSLISNEQMKIKFNSFKAMIIMLMNFFTPMIYMFNNDHMIFNNFNFFFKEITPVNFMLTKQFFNIELMYIYPMNNLTLISILFILMAFISIIKINSSTHSHSMRKINKYE